MDTYRRRRPQLTYGKLLSARKRNGGLGNGVGYQSSAGTAEGSVTESSASRTDTSESQSSGRASAPPSPRKPNAVPQLKKSHTIASTNSAKAPRPKQNSGDISTDIAIYDVPLSDDEPTPPKPPGRRRGFTTSVVPRKAGSQSVKEKGPIAEEKALPKLQKVEAIPKRVSRMGAVLPRLLKTVSAPPLQKPPELDYNSRAMKNAQVSKQVQPKPAQKEVTSSATSSSRKRSSEEIREVGNKRNAVTSPEKAGNHTAKPIAVKTEPRSPFKFKATKPVQPNRISKSDLPPKMSITKKRVSPPPRSVKPTVAVNKTLATKTATKSASVLQNGVTKIKAAAYEEHTINWEMFLEKNMDAMAKETGKTSMKRSRQPGDDGTCERECSPPRRRRLIDVLMEEEEEKEDTPARAPSAPVDALGVDSGEKSECIAVPALQAITTRESVERDYSSQSQTAVAGTASTSQTQTFGARSSRVTYARQRSFLTEQPVENADPLALFLSKPLLAKSQFDEGLEEDESSLGMVRSLHELREAGDNKRFIDTAEGYLEDIEGNTTIGQKRSSYMELATKLTDKAFLYKFRASDFDHRLLSKFKGQDDEIIWFTLSFIVCTFLQEDRSFEISKTALRNNIVSMLDRMLNSERDINSIAKDKRTNMSKAARSLVADLCRLVEQTGVFTKRPKIMSCQVMALAVADYLMKNLRASGKFSNCFPANTLKRLVSILNSFVETKDIGKRKALEPVLLELAVSTLESHSTGTDIPASVTFNQAELRTLAQTLQAVVEIGLSETKDIQFLLLRLNINLTNRQPAVCDAFGEPAVIAALVNMAKQKFDMLSGPVEEEERVVGLDLLVLSLALMINLAELSEKARLAFIDDEPHGPRLTQLVKLFQERFERAAEAASMEETESNVAFGYLSILLGNLCQSAAVRQKIQAEMEKQSIAPIVSAVQEFIMHHKKVDEERRRASVDEEEEEDEEDDALNWHAGFIHRLEQVAVRLRAISD